MPEVNSSNVPEDDKAIPVEEQLARTQRELDIANARLQKWRVERQLARQAADSAYQIVKEQNEELKKQVALFRKFVPRSLSGMLDRRGFDVAKGISLERTYSVFSTDIRGFTTFSESISSQDCFRFLNSFFTAMEPAIRKCGGFVYQYVGDSIMALFPLRAGEYSDNAVDAAVLIQSEIIPDYNDKRRISGYEPIRIGIGVNTGSVATGIAGTTERMDACAFGSSVNLAARCEEFTKGTEADIIVTEFTKARLENPDRYAMESIGVVEIRGMAKQVELFGIDSR